MNNFLGETSSKKRMKIKSEYSKKSEPKTNMKRSDCFSTKIYIVENKKNPVLKFNIYDLFLGIHRQYLANTWRILGECLEQASSYQVI